jgi:hypothetical protein
MTIRNLQYRAERAQAALDLAIAEKQRGKRQRASSAPPQRAGAGGQAPNPAPATVAAVPVKALQQEKRLAIKTIFNGMIDQAKDPRNWKGQGGTFSQIRNALGGQAPARNTIQKTLDTLVAGGDVSDYANGGGHATVLSRAEQLIAADSLEAGSSLKTATMDVNMARDRQGKSLVSTKPVRTAERDLEMVGRRRQHQKVGSTDAKGAWAVARRVQCSQFRGQLKLGDWRAADRASRDALKAAVDARAALAAAVTRGLRATATAHLEKAEAALVDARAAAAAAAVESGEGFEEILIYLPDEERRPGDGSVVRTVTGRTGTLVTKPSLVPGGAPRLMARVEVKQPPSHKSSGEPALELEGIMFGDEHHEQSRLGCVSRHDRAAPRGPGGEYLSVDHGGTYANWRNEPRPKFIGDARGLFNVAIKRDPATGELEGHALEPFDYTGRVVLGVEGYEKVVAAEVNRVMGTCTGGAWAPYVKGAAHLPGKMYEKRYGANWRAEVLKTSALKKCCCVIDMMAHTIKIGNAHYADTPWAESWMIYHDHLSQWWEAGAQAWLAKRGFKDRQVRIRDGVPAIAKRYQGKLVGNTPELMPLDSHLFQDFKDAVLKHVVLTAGLPKRADGSDDPRMFKMGTPNDLMEAMVRVWSVAPTGKRIVQDVLHWRLAVQAIVDAGGVIVPDMDNRRGRRATAGRPGVRAKPGTARKATYDELPLHADAKHAVEVRHEHYAAMVARLEEELEELEDPDDESEGEGEGESESEGEGESEGGE